MSYRVAQLTPSNVPLLKALLKVFGEAFEDADAYRRAAPSDAYLESLLAKPYFIVVVATDGDKVIGGLAAYELEKFEQDRREIYIYDLAVSEHHRRKGVATQLIDELRLVATRRKAYVIFVQADKGDIPAIRLYESLGTKEDVLHFDIAVPGDALLPIRELP
ncbi:MAG: AAC(3)-I family aminoglycoside N-acetyltransferase [Bryobacteraceae bacterium]